MSRPAAFYKLLIFILLVNSWNAFGQHRSGNSANPMPSEVITLTGTVYTETGDHPIQHAYVRLCDGGGNMLTETITSESGQFAFRGIQRGNYILQVSAAGFEQTSSNMDLSFHSDRGIQIYLKPTPADASESATPAKISAHEMAIQKKARDLLASGKKKLYEDKDPQGGLEDFKSAVSIAPGFYEAYYQIALGNLTLGKTLEAETNFRKSIEISGDKDGESEVGLGTLMIDRGEYLQGEKTVRRGIELEPSFWLGHYQLARALLIENNLPDALRSADQAKSLAPTAPIVYRLLSNIHLRQKDYPALLGDIDAYLKLDPDSPAALRAKQLREQVAQRVGTVKTPPATQSKP